MATESFFSNASLAYLASAGAGKDGKAYSIKPTDGTGDFTFSRGSNLAATRVGADGLIEKGRENLLTYSNDFTQWTQVYVNTPTTGHAGYDGSNDAWLIERDGTAGGARVEKSISVSGVNTFSFYAKANSLEWVNLISTSSPFPLAYFHLSGSGFASPSNVIDAKIQRVGTSDWYRCSITFNFSGSTGFRIRPADGDGIISGTSGSIYIQHAQAEIGLAATDYIESGATTGKAGLLENEPRFDYSGGATCPSLLLEPSRTNLVKYSEYFGAGWSSNDTTITYNTAISPEGIQNATTIADTSTTDRQQFQYDFSYVAGASYVWSVFVKKDDDESRFPLFFFRVYGSGTDNKISIQINTKTGAKDIVSDDGDVSSDVIDFNDDYWRVVLIVNDQDDGNNSVRSFITPAAASVFGGNDSTTTGSITIYGFQVEQGSYPTSYIPNHSGGSVTRGADVATGAGDASTFNDAEGVLYVEISALADDLIIDGISVSDGSTSNRVVIFTWSSSNTMRARVSSNGVNVLNQTIIVSDITDFNKIAISYKLNDFKVYLNGTNVFSETSGATPIGLNTLSFTTDGGTSTFFHGSTKQVLYFPTALSDADCIALTS